jgi:hypothetical protein
MWHTGVKHTLYYHESRPCFMCGEEKEEWRNVMTCRSLDASLHRVGSWEEVKKDMAIWQFERLLDRHTKMLAILHRSSPTTG